MLVINQLQYQIIQKSTKYDSMRFCTSKIPFQNVFKIHCTLPNNVYLLRLAYKKRHLYITRLLVCYPFGHSLEHNTRIPLPKII